ncbi:hypothetical protein N7495_008165 [Penicillium taxi]|uniref:uncharacterized protein n=1 Tax=Penicillium taxi TaxID=168475 RepID=UPI0025454790|nr:uncharacterized protein N7495_008165 [Penicillium taxi]KAJ5888124.1 hypothetical protein N7495_008165 [Penicillium taxi]
MAQSQALWSCQTLGLVGLPDFTGVGHAPEDVLEAGRGTLFQVRVELISVGELVHSVVLTPLFIVFND